MLPLFDKNATAGLSLAEIMVGVAITGIVSLVALDQFTQLNRGMWANENRADTSQQLNQVSDMIRGNLPQFIPSAVGSDGETNPVGLWTCIENQRCTMSITYNTETINPIVATCEPLQNVALRGTTQQSIFKAQYMDPSLGVTSCLACGANDAPRLTINTYDIDAATNRPVLRNTVRIPSVENGVGNTSRNGALAMGVCVEAKPYQYNHGTSTAPYWAARYDRWAVSLMPVFLARQLRPGLTGTTFTQDLMGALSSIPEKLMLAPSRQFSPGIIYTPVR